MATEGAIAAYAGSHGLVVEPEAKLRALTPALLTGDRGSIGPVATGRLAPGLSGKLIAHVFADGPTRRESAIVLTEVPETVAFIPALVCRDRKAMGDGDPAQLPAESWEATTLESEAFNRRYHLLTLAGQEPGLVRELFSPQLIAWLTDKAPDGLSFELNEGHLTVAMPGPLDGADAASGLCGAAAELAARIRKEGEEEDLNPDLFDESAELAAIESAMARVTFDKPPASVQEAIGAYRNLASNRPYVLLSALFWTVLIAGIVGGLIALISPLVGIAAGLIVAVATFPIARLVYASRYRWGTASVQRVGYEAWVREYARERKLELRDRWRFHADHRHLAMPGFADHVLAGPLPGTQLDALLVSFGDAAELRSEGQEIAYITDRPLASNAVIVRLHDAPSPADLAKVKLPDEYRAGVAGDDLLVYRPILGNLIKTSAGTDNFRKHAAEVIAEIRAGTERT
jgi:hypothetical protein